MKRRNFFGALSAVVATMGFRRQPSASLAPIPAEAEQIWTTKDGRDVRVCDMTDEHLRNCIMWQLRAAGYREYPYLSYGNPEAMKRFPLFDVMRREANRRHLSWI